MYRTLLTRSSPCLLKKDTQEQVNMTGRSLGLSSAQIQCIQSRNFFDMEWIKDLLNNFMDHMKNTLV